MVLVINVTETESAVPSYGLFATADSPVIGYTVGAEPYSFGSRPERVFITAAAIKQLALGLSDDDRAKLRALL